LGQRHIEKMWGTGQMGLRKKARGLAAVLQSETDRPGKPHLQEKKEKETGHFFFLGGGGFLDRKNFKKELGEEHFKGGGGNCQPWDFRKGGKGDTNGKGVCKVRNLT